MANICGVSGSTILSNPNLFSELFWEGVKHVEIGGLPNEEALYKFLKLCREKNCSFGIHAPLLHNGSRYDLIEEVKYTPEYAWKQTEIEAQKVAKLGGKYLLVHFPYFREEVKSDTNKAIEEGLKKLRYLQEKYSIMLVCEPKLGLNRSSVGINYLNQFPIATWAKYNIKLCIDIGDYVIATDNSILDYLSKFKRFIKVVHLHNIHYEDGKHIWIPVHPTQEYIGSNKLIEIIKWLSKCDNITFVFEHTPETNPAKEFVREGYEWVNSIINGTVSSEELDGVTEMIGNLSEVEKEK